MNHSVDNNNNNKFIAADITQVTSEENLDHEWPVSIQEYTLIANQAYTDFCDVLRNLAPDQQQVMLTETSSLNLLINFINFNLAEERCRATKTNFRFGDLTGTYKREAFPDVFYQLGKTKPTNNFSSYVKNIVKNYKYVIDQRLSGRNFQSLATQDENNGLLFSVKSQLQLDYVKSNFKSAKFLDFAINAIVRQKRSSAKSRIFDDVIRELVNRLSISANLCDDGLFQEKLIQSWSRKLADNEVLIREFQKLFDVHSNLFVGSSAKPISKALSFACRNAGGTTTSFSHGNEMGLHVDCEFIRPITEFQCYDNFVFSSSKIARRYMNLSSKTDFYVPFSCNFISSKARTYQQLLSRNAVKINKQADHGINTVMVLGYPMGPYRIWSYENSFFYDALKIELQICKLLKQSGYKVLYKAHPDRVGYIENIMAPIVDQVVTNKFEDVMNLADLFVFHYTHTTTFGAALCSQTPITLFTSELQNFDPQDLNLLKTRVSIVEKDSSSSTERLLESVKNPITNFPQKNILELIE